MEDRALIDRVVEIEPILNNIGIALIIQDWQRLSCVSRFFRVKIEFRSWVCEDSSKITLI